MTKLPDTVFQTLLITARVLRDAGDRETDRESDVAQRYYESAKELTDLCRWLKDYDSAERHAEAETVMQAAISEASLEALRGKLVSDFMESFPAVRESMELRAAVIDAIGCSRSCPGCAGRLRGVLPNAPTKEDEKEGG